MTVNVLTEIVIDRPCEQVARYASDPSKTPEWYENIESVELATSPPLRVGSKMDFSARFLGRKLVYTYEVTEFMPAKRLVMRTSQGPFPMETTYTWECAGSDSTRMTLRNRGEPRDFSTLMAPFLKRAIRRANRKDLLRLKEILESAE